VLEEEKIMPIYDSYESGEEYFFNQVALELKKFMNLPGKEFNKKKKELLEKYKKLEVD